MKADKFSLYLDSLSTRHAVSRRADLDWSPTSVGSRRHLKSSATDSTRLRWAEFDFKLTSKRPPNRWNLSGHCHSSRLESPTVLSSFLYNLSYCLYFHCCLSSKVILKYPNYTGAREHSGVNHLHI